MAKIVCIDALVYLGTSVFTERNEVTVSLDVEVAEARPFVGSLALAFPDKASTWKNATVSLNGFYDDANFAPITSAIAGSAVVLKVYPTRSDLSNYWHGSVIINSLEHSITSEDFSELNIETEVSGALSFFNS